MASVVPLASVLGVVRSLWMYYGDPGRLRRMRRFYARLLRPGDLAFDVGAHVGSRTWIWSRLGARVVAVEPVPQAMRVLRLLHGRNPRVVLVQAAVGRQPGHLPLLVSEREPTVSTLSTDWADRMLRERNAFARTRWGRSVVVPVVTLDELIARYGRPAFCKIDVEGYDLEVLHGLSEPLAALSFEYVPPALDLALACLERLAALGHYEFNWSWGESMHLRWPEWVEASTLADYLRGYPAQGTPGDVYARLASRSTAYGMRRAAQTVMTTNQQPARSEDEPVFAPNLSTGREEVGRGNPEAGPVESPNFYGTGTDDLRAGSGKIEASGEGLPATDQPQGPVSGPRDSQGGLVDSQGIPITDSRAHQG